eukprot:384928-Prymnesium_polylepis.1
MNENENVRRLVRRSAVVLEHTILLRSAPRTLRPMELILGLLAIVTGCFSSALGFQLMKRSSVVEAGLPLYKAPRWLAGFFLLAVVQTLADAISLSFLPLSVVAPFA